MDPDKAWELLNEIVSQVAMNRNSHMKAGQALEALRPAPCDEKKEVIDA